MFYIVLIPVVTISTKALDGLGPTHKPSEQFKNLVCNEPSWQSSN